MNDINILISDIKQNVKMLILELNQVRKELYVLREECERLKIENLELKKEALAKESSSLKTENTCTLSTEQKLNELINEIDKCISLMQN
ncbi:MAG: hypothetical protein GX259_07085 [Bacteroidales bacterium]|nr:hypothetical protein [Bacteroidales bacterium]